MNQVAIVTGGNSGIGKQTAIELANKGAKVIIHYLDDAVLKSSGTNNFEHTQEGMNAALETREIIEKNGGNAEIFGGDLADVASIKELIRFTNNTLGIPNILINNAAHCELPDNLLESTWETIDRHFMVNSRAAILLTKEVAKGIIHSSWTYGRIINISTDAAQCFPNQISYGASKAALESYTKSIAVELGKYNITVNAIAPGPIQTGWIDSHLEKQILRNLPIKRLGEPNDIAHVVGFLSDIKASWITGQILKVSGGNNI